MNRSAIAPGLVFAGPDIEYRHDLDGLRGLAIGLVVVFHVWAERVSGGVDIFLALSGFFFTGMLLRRSTATEGPAIVPVLRRTARRLLPPLVAVLATILAVTVAYIPYTRWETTAREALASLLYFQNWVLAASPSNYRTADASVSPMQHLWSMAVQVQFYLFSLLAIATLAWLCRRYALPLRRVLTATLIVVSLASFWYAYDLGGRAQSLAYYDTFARSWELFAGALLAVLAYRVTLSPAIRNAVSVAALLVVLGCGIVINGVDHYPGPLALVPVGAAIALIALGPDTTTGRLLATRPFTELGPPRLLALPLALAGPHRLPDAARPTRCRTGGWRRRHRAVAGARLRDQPTARRTPTRRACARPSRRDRAGRRAGADVGDDVAGADRHRSRVVRPGADPRSRPLPRRRSAVRQRTDAGRADAPHRVGSPERDSDQQPGRLFRRRTGQPSRQLHVRPTEPIAPSLWSAARIPSSG